MHRTFVQEYERICLNSGSASSAAAGAAATEAEPQAGKRVSTESSESRDTFCGGWRGFAADVGPGVTVHFIAVFLMACFFVVILTVISEKEDAVEDVSVLFDKTQRPSHLDALSRSDVWHHDGHLASWVRRYVLPSFKDRAARSLISCEIKAAILDPANIAVCSAYLDHVMSLEPDEQRFRTLDDLAVELCSSICVFVRERRADTFEIEVYLKPDLNFIRNDITSVRAFWTTTGKSKPAVALENRPSSTFYHLVVRNFAVSVRRYRKIDMSAAMTAYAAITEDDELARVKAMLSNIFPTSPNLTDTQFCARVVARCSGI
jgi:hypothetical protein